MRFAAGHGHQPFVPFLAIGKNRVKGHAVYGRMVKMTNVCAYVEHTVRTVARTET